ncbi:MAG: CsgG/HfaB family protein, partial [Betaproteobacteria bacterium]
VADSLRGVVDSYEILSETPDGSGWEISVRAMVARLVSDGSKRKPLAIIPFTAGRGEISIFGEGWDGREASRLLTQLLVDKVTSTRRFAVIDREFIDVTQQEASLKVDNPLTPMTQLLELANRLVAEYMIVGQLEGITATRTSNYVELLKREVFTDSASATVSLRLIDVGSDQVKYAGTDVFNFGDDDIPKGGGATAIGTRLLEVAAERITESMLDAIYPLSLVSVDGDVVTLNQGGDTLRVGNLYELYRYGEKIIDPYT